MTWPQSVTTWEDVLQMRRHLAAAQTPAAPSLAISAGSGRLPPPDGASIRNDVAQAACRACPACYTPAVTGCCGEEWTEDYCVRFRTIQERNRAIAEGPICDRWPTAPPAPGSSGR